MKESWKLLQIKETDDYEMNDGEMNEMTSFNSWFNRNHQETWNYQ